MFHSKRRKNCLIKDKNFPGILLRVSGIFCLPPSSAKSISGIRLGFPAGFITFVPERSNILNGKIRDWWLRQP